MSRTPVTAVMRDEQAAIGCGDQTAIVVHDSIELLQQLRCFAQTIERGGSIDEEMIGGGRELPAQRRD